MNSTKKPHASLCIIETSRLGARCRVMDKKSNDALLHYSENLSIRCVEFVRALGLHDLNKNERQTNTSRYHNLFLALSFGASLGRRIKGGEGVGEIVLRFCILK